MLGVLLNQRRGCVDANAVRLSRSCRPHLNIFQYSTVLLFLQYLWLRTGYTVPTPVKLCCIMAQVVVCWNWCGLHMVMVCNTTTLEQCGRDVGENGHRAEHQRRAAAL